MQASPAARSPVQDCKGLKKLVHLHSKGAGRIATRRSMKLARNSRPPKPIEENTTTGGLESRLITASTLPLWGSLYKPGGHLESSATFPFGNGCSTGKRLVEPQRAGNRGEAQAIRLNPARSVWGPILFCHPPPVVSLCIRAIDSLWGPGAANRAPLQSIFWPFPRGIEVAASHARRAGPDRAGAQRRGSPGSRRLAREGRFTSATSHQRHVGRKPETGARSLRGAWFQRRLLGSVVRERADPELGRADD